LDQGAVAEWSLRRDVGRDAASTTSARESRTPLAGGAADEHDWRVVTPVAARLEVALEARAPGVYIGTPLVRKLAVQVSRQLGLDDQEQLAVDICAPSGTSG
jgi:hypothetical protein